VERTSAQTPPQIRDPNRKTRKDTSEGVGDHDFYRSRAAAAWWQKVGDAAADAAVQPVEHVDQLDCGRHGAEPDREPAEAVAYEWMSGVIPETRFSVSPGRLHHQCELISDWVDDELTRVAIALLPDWVTWLAERAASTPSHCAPNWPTH
jgi:hypothetical protein